jgi:hypothetical protein
MRNVCNILVGKDYFLSSRRGYMLFNFKTYIKQTRFEGVVSDDNRIQWRAFVNNVMNLQIPLNTITFLII